MSSSKAASLAARLIESNNPNRSRRGDESDEDQDALFAELEEEIENDSNPALREHGLQALKAEMDRMKHMQENQYGRYTEIKDEKEVVRVTAHDPRVVVHFFHPNFQRCEIMDKHLDELAPKYANTRFARVFVENVPWLVEKLHIKVLPCVIVFVNGVAKDRVVGFEELGNTDSFNTAVLELRLSQTGVLAKRRENALDPVFKVASSRRQKYDDDGDDFDL